jgi:hypothetical protein
MALSLRRRPVRAPLELQAGFEIFSHENAGNRILV